MIPLQNERNIDANWKLVVVMLVILARKFGSWRSPRKAGIVWRSVSALFSQAAEINLVHRVSVMRKYVLMENVKN